MPKIIFLETSTSLCSTALSDGDRIICTRRSSEARVHASKTAVFVKEMLDECAWKVGDCDAVCVSKGPGSYTGLRVGASTAKGLCFGAGIPLLAVGTLDTLAWQALALPELGHFETIVPMIDARRMEVYTAAFKVEKEAAAAGAGNGAGGGKTVRACGEAEALVVDADSFAAELAAGPVLFIGDGAAKCEGVIKVPETAPGVPPRALFLQQCPEAASMLRPALELWKRRSFEDIAYFEPFYLKEFVATVGKKLF